jgi:ubiquinone/menaquinone biosynthesis C-methylase UbiE
MGILGSFYAERVFPWLLDKSLRGRVIDDLTRTALAPAHGEVLEIGFGSARSLPHYPTAVTSLWTVEPSVGMSRRALDRISLAKFPVHMEPGTGEKLPFDAGRFDTVSLVLTLCSVQNVGAVLLEARRVLKPGGLLVMMEHVASAEPRWQKWQRRLDPLQNVLACGCHLTRDPEALAVAAGFRWQQLTRQVVPEFPGRAELYPILIGCAVAVG